VLALPVAAADQATERAERIRTTLASRPILAPSGELNVTASLGLAYALPGRLGSPKALITAADRCLYQAKRTGRDRLVIGEDPIPLADDGSAFETEMG
jgi:diguanylate cyclase (GGDEF)-like protein